MNNTINKRIKVTKSGPRRICVFTYLPEGMHDALRARAEPGEERWESAMVRRIIREWLEIKGIRWEGAVQGSKREVKIESK